MTLSETASRINAHLRRFAADPSIAERKWIDGEGQERTLTLYWRPNCSRGGAYALITYVAYQGHRSLPRARAEQYLAWLDAGNIGTHYKALQAPPPKDARD